MYTISQANQATLHAELEAISEIIKLHPNKDDDIFNRTTLYVTIEPCIMCASALRQVIEVFLETNKWN